MRIYLIRHGHRADQEPQYDGSSNTPLSACGRRQADLMAAHMAEKSLCALYSSCLLRAIETALPLQTATGLPLNIWPVLCETTMKSLSRMHAEQSEQISSCTAWPGGRDGEASASESHEPHADVGYRLSDLRRRFPGSVLSQPYPWPDAWWQGLQNECFERGWVRLQFAVDALLARHAREDRIAVVGHGISGDIMLSILMQLPAVPSRRFAAHNTGITRFDLMHTGQRVLYYGNRTAHLDGEALIS